MGLCLESLHSKATIGEKGRWIAFRKSGSGQKGNPSGRSPGRVLRNNPQRTLPSSPKTNANMNPGLGLKVGILLLWRKVARRLTPAGKTGPAENELVTFGRGSNVKLSKK